MSKQANPWRSILDKSLSIAAFNLSEQMRSQLCQYLDLLLKWNNAYNLTAITQPDAIISRHIMDSLAISPLLKGEKIIDVGTGAGLPGIPLAIMFPEKNFVLLDSRRKKTQFLVQVVTQLQLKNVHVEQKRVEVFKPVGLFDVIISRAFASLDKMLFLTHHLCKTNGCFLAMKGLYPEEELTNLTQSAEYKIMDVLPITVVGLQAERHVVIINRA